MSVQGLESCYTLRMEMSSRLETKRLILGPLNAWDFAFFFRLLGNRHARQYLGGVVPLRQRVLRFRAYRIGAPGVGIWIVKLRHRRRAVGLVVLNPHRDGTDYEISYEFHPKFWGNGFAEEALRVVVSHALAESLLPRIIAETQQANTASCSLLRQLGFVEQRRLERFGAEQIIFATQPQDEVQGVS